MPVDLTPEAWAQARYEYEHTDKPVDDICLDHGISPNTLRDRVRRWRWTRRRQPIPAEGPPPALRNEPALPFVGAPPFGMAPPEPAAAPREGTAALPAPHATPGEAAPVDPAEIVPRLQGAVARVLPAIEAIVARLAAEPMPPREMERAVRTLTSLTRTLRELNELLSQHQPAAAASAIATTTCRKISTRSGSSWRDGSRRSWLRIPTMKARSRRRREWRTRRKRRRSLPSPPLVTLRERAHVPLELLTRLRLAVSTFTPGPIVEEIATRLM